MGSILLIYLRYAQVWGEMVPENISTAK